MSPQVTPLCCGSIRNAGVLAAGEPLHGSLLEVKRSGWERTPVEDAEFDTDYLARGC